MSNREPPKLSSTFRHLGIDEHGYVVDSATNPELIGTQVQQYADDGQIAWQVCDVCRGNTGFCADHEQEARIKGAGWIHRDDGKLYNTNAKQPSRFSEQTRIVLSVILLALGFFALYLKEGKLDPVGDAAKAGQVVVDEWQARRKREHERKSQDTRGAGQKNTRLQTPDESREGN